MKAAQFCLIWNNWSIKTSFKKDASISAGKEPDFLSFTLALTLAEPDSTKCDMFLGQHLF